MEEVLSIARLTNDAFLFYHAGILIPHIVLRSPYEWSY